ncbi:MULTISPECIES: alginate lyase family protein [unclassified Herbaspirillum]|nr:MULTISPECIES: alginate lyase family protein [unclassified Herbaspirillum]RFB69451.1 alginate lyase [Herbaspirillum sp. 3R-3a1]TFI07493.1 alginate lyase [Herbaspirillum sp. 3R11]TFI12267.1 alginate lyase [Herbaspirillum sp. 3R-11]
MPDQHVFRRPFVHLLALLCLLIAAPFASSQSLWPSSQQWEQLRRDPKFKQAMTAQHRIADEALAAEPQPIATLSSGGRLQGDAVKGKTAASIKDMDKIQALAVTYKMTGDARYAARAGAFLDAWAARNQPTGQPIDETGLEPGIFGYRIVRTDLPVAARERIDTWMRNIAQAEIDSRVLKRPTATNNWHSHRLKIVGLIGYAIGDAKLIIYAKNGFRAQINDNLRPGGESIDFIERDALSYHVYDLRPLVTLALAFAEDGEDLYHWQAPNGASVARSVTWLLPYVRGEKTHAEFAGSQVPFDKARSDNHEKGHEIGTPYDPKNAQPLMDLAAAYDPACAELARSLGSGNNARLRLALSSLKNG